MTDKHYTRAEIEKAIFMEELHGHFRTDEMLRQLLADLDGMAEVLKLMNTDYDSEMMKTWDIIRKTIADGCTSDLPRIIFEGIFQHAEDALTTYQTRYGKKGE